MAPIKVGFIGLTSNTTTRPNDGTLWAVGAHLQYLKSSPKYEVVALLNSTKENALQAIEEHGLGKGVKAYGDPKDLAADKDVELVVCSVRVDRHHPTVVPSILAGKDIFCEWPLGANLKEAQEMHTLAEQHKSKTAVALQATFSPIISKIKELVDSGRIGKILSSTYIGSHTTFGVSEDGKGSISEAVKYFAERDVGGSMLTIHFGHSIEFILSVIGEFKTWDSLMAIQRPIIDVVNKDKEVITKDVKLQTPDLIMVNGITTAGTVLSYHIRAGLPFPGVSPVEWRLYGSTGEIRLTGVQFLNVETENAKIELLEYGKNNGESVVIETGKDEFSDLAIPGRNIARVYEAFAEGKKGGEDKAGYRDFGFAVKRHEMIEKMWERYDAQQQ